MIEKGGESKVPNSCKIKTMIIHWEISPEYLTYLASISPTSPQHPTYLTHLSLPTTAVHHRPVIGCSPQIKDRRVDSFNKNLRVRRPWLAWFLEICYRQNVRAVSHDLINIHSGRVETWRPESGQTMEAGEAIRSLFLFSCFRFIKTKWIRTWLSDRDGSWQLEECWDRETGESRGAT